MNGKVVLEMISHTGGRIPANFEPKKSHENDQTFEIMRHKERIVGVRVGTNDHMPCSIEFLIKAEN